MTTYTVTTTTTWDALSAPSGSNHTVNINGGSLTIDTDTRYNAVFTASTGTIGNVTISSTLGGSLTVDGTKVRLIPYNSGVSGNVPAIGTTISQGGVSATLLGVWSALNVAPTAAGAAMPASGFIKVKNKTGGNFAAGALTGIGASASAADVAGWIEVVGVQSAGITIPRLGSFTCTGDWFTPIDTAGAAVTTNGSANQTIQLPASLDFTFYGGVWIETGAGTNTYEFYASIADNAGSSLVATGAVRGKVVWFSTQGLLRIGSDGTNTNGYVPPSGCRIRIPNIILLNATSGAPTGNITPSAGLATRYKTVSSLGYISIDKVVSSWYLNCSNSVYASISNSAICSQIIFSNAVTASASNVVVGIVRTTDVQQGLVDDNSSFHTYSNVYILRQNYTVRPRFLGCSNLSVTNLKIATPGARSTGTTNNIDLTVSNSTIDGLTCIGARVNITSSTNSTIKNIIYCDRLGTTTDTSNGSSAVVVSLSTGTVIDGFSFGGLTNVQSYDYVFNVLGSFNTVIKNIGSVVSPLSLGSSNISAGLLSVAGPGSFASSVSLKRVYTTATPRTRFINADITASGLALDNVWSDASVAIFASATTVSLSSLIRGCYGNSTPLASFTNVTDTIFWDAFTGATTGLIGIYMNEATSSGYASFVSLTGTAKFTGTGALYCPTSGDTATWTWPHYILGYTSLANVAPTITGGTSVSSRITVEYQLDKNDGNGFGSWKTLSAANLSAETGIDAAQGFKPKIRVTVDSTDTTNNTITGIYFQGTTDSTSQQTTYPIENSANLVCPNFVSGTRVYAARQQTYSGLTNSAINTSDDSITLGLSDAGFSPSLQTFAPRSLVRFNLTSGTIPTTSPQIIDGGLYYLKTYNSSNGKITLSVTSGGTTIDFTSAPTCTFQLVTETELLNTTVSGGSGLTTALQLPTNATVRIKAIYWTNSGTCRASNMLDGLYSWNESTGLRIIDVVSGTAEGSADTIHNVLIDASSITMPDGGTITPVNDGSTITSLAYALEGVGKVQINANETDGQLEVQNLYLWGVYAASTAAGIRVISADTFYAENVFSFVVQNLEFDNISLTPLYLRGGIIKTADGSAFVTPNTTGSIIPNTDTVGTGVILNLGTSPTQQEIRDAMALSTSATINSGSIDQLVRAAKNAAEANL